MLRLQYSPLANSLPSRRLQCCPRKSTIECLSKPKHALAWHINHFPSVAVRAVGKKGQPEDEPTPKHYWSKYNGVTYEPRNPKKPWRARVRKGSIPSWSKICSTEEEAARTYDVMALALLGDQAMLNFPEDKKKAKAQVPEALAQRKSGGSSPYRGVSWKKAANRWRMRITHNKKSYERYFVDEKDAARAYDAKAWEFGKKAKLNFPEEYGMK